MCTPGANGQPDFVQAIRRKRSRRARSSSAGNHCAACESPTSTTVRFAVGSPNTQPIGGRLDAVADVAALHRGVRRRGLCLERRGRRRDRARLRAAEQADAAGKHERASEDRQRDDRGRGGRAAEQQRPADGRWRTTPRVAPGPRRGRGSPLPARRRSRRPRRWRSSRCGRRSVPSARFARRRDRASATGTRRTRPCRRSGAARSDEHRADAGGRSRPHRPRSRAPRPRRAASAARARELGRRAVARERRDDRRQSPSDAGRSGGDARRADQQRRSERDRPHLRRTPTPASSSRSRRSRACAAVSTQRIRERGATDDARSRRTARTRTPGPRPRRRVAASTRSSGQRGRTAPRR